MAIQRVPVEDVPDIIMQQSRGNDLFDSASLIVGGIELQQWLWPETPLGERGFDVPRDLWVRDVDEAANILRIVINDLSVSIEYVHSSTC